MLRLSTFLLLFTLVLHALASSRDDSNDCPAHQEHLTCGTACPENCENYANYPVNCTKECRNACFCKFPYIFKSGRDGLCTLPEDCPRMYTEYQR